MPGENADIPKEQTQFLKGKIRSLQSLVNHFSGSKAPWEGQFIKEKDLKTIAEDLTRPGHKVRRIVAIVAGGGGGGGKL